LAKFLGVALTVGAASANVFSSIFQGESLDSYFAHPPLNHALDDRRDYSDKTVMEILREQKEFSSMRRLVEESADSGFRDDLDSKDQKLTMFVPTNDAFKRIQELIPDFKPDQETMREILKYHVLKDELEKEGFKNEQVLRTKLKPESLSGEHQVIRVAEFQKAVYLNFWVRVERFDLRASNGVIHVIGAVLLPPQRVLDLTFMLSFKFSTFAAAMQITGLDKELRDKRGITAFVPDNSAFNRLGCQLPILMQPYNRKLLKEVLKYHISEKLQYSKQLQKEHKIDTWYGQDKLSLNAVVVPGKEQRRVMVNEYAQIWLPDLPTENGVIQAIDEVLIPQSIELTPC